MSLSKWYSFSMNLHAEDNICDLFKWNKKRKYAWSGTKWRCRFLKFHSYTIFFLNMVHHNLQANHRTNCCPVANTHNMLWQESQTFQHILCPRLSCAQSPPVPFPVWLQFHYAGAFWNKDFWFKTDILVMHCLSLDHNSFKLATCSK